MRERASENVATTEGFTLVEMAIVLVIVGLLISGILVGQSLIQSAKVNKTLRDIEQFKIQFGAFQDMFRYQPGDHPAFSEMVPDSAAQIGTYGNAINGDGNGRINDWPEDGDAWEQAQVWVHLAFTGLISADFQTLYTYPETPWGGSYTFDHNGTDVVGDPVHAPNKLRIELSAGSTVWKSEALLSPAQSLALDAKADDGNPLTGNVLSFVGSGVGSGNLCRYDNPNLITGGGAKLSDVYCVTWFVIEDAIR